MEVLPIRTKVELNEESGVEGVIDLVQISSIGVNYHVTWWDSRSKCDAWFSEDEFTVLDKKVRRTQIGFK